MNAETVLLAEDDGGVRTVVAKALSREGYVVRSTSVASALWSWIAEGEGDVVITDVGLPDGNSLDLLPRIKSLRPDLPIIVMSAQNTLLTAIRATERGAYEYLPKPFDLDSLVATVRRSLKRRSERRSHKPTPAPEESLPIIGRSPSMQEIYRVIAKLTATDLTVLIAGESGTGKELVAKALHDYSKRKDGPFVAVNMAAIPRELIESELFGHEKGSFTGAQGRRSGRFEQAQGGTLFLDEIGDMPLDAQTRLLRVLQQGEFLPIGAVLPIRTDVRIVAASHRDLNSMVAQGLFREDLFYRLNVVPLRLPPLRERVEDIPSLVQHFFSKVQAEGLPFKTVTPDAMRRLQAHSWPGNVRELENLVRRLAVLCNEDTIDGATVAAEALRDRPSAEANGELVDDSLEAAVDRHLDRLVKAQGDGSLPMGLHDVVLQEVERPLIAKVLHHTRGNQLRAADILGLNRNTLRKKIRELDIRLVRGV